MKKSQTKAQRVAKWLADAIMTEMEKPDEEIDVEFVESCENLLNTLMGEHKLSDKEINARVNEIMLRGTKVHTIPTRRKTKPAIIALIAAVVLLLSCVTVFAITPLGENLLKALNLDVNQGFTDGGITYSYNGKINSYKTIDELLESENLDICYPEKFAYNIKLTQIFTSEDKGQIVFTFDDPRISFEIHPSISPDPMLLDSAEVLDFKDHSFYLHYIDSVVTAIAVINNDYYNLKCDSKEQLIEMIYSFNFERMK